MMKKQLEQINIDLLMPYGKNSRTHSEGASTGKQATHVSTGETLADVEADSNLAIAEAA
jgi:hypothetical protein